MNITGAENRCGDFTLQVSLEELVCINNALNEILHNQSYDESEFSTIFSISRRDAVKLLERIGSILP